MVNNAFVAIATLVAVATLAACSGGVEATEVRTYAPWAPGGELNADVKLAGEVTGACFGSASSVQRSDAFRCSLDSPSPDGSTLADPCFAGPLGKLACVNEPGGQATILSVTEPLPEPGRLEDVPLRTASLGDDPRIRKDVRPCQWRDRLSRVGASQLLL
jgi:hypothetical protein